MWSVYLNNACRCILGYFMSPFWAVWSCLASQQQVGLDCTWRTVNQTVLQLTSDKELINVSNLIVCGNITCNRVSIYNKHIFIVMGIQRAALENHRQSLLALR